MGFLEEEKRRLEKRRRTEEKIKKFREKKLEEKKKRLNKKVGHIVEKLLKKINEKQKYARLHGIDKASNFSGECKWKINYIDSEEDLKLELSGNHIGSKKIKCLVDKNMHMRIKVGYTRPLYLSNGHLKINIKNEKFLDHIADILIEIRYTGECERLESFFLSNSNMLKRISSQLKRYDDLIDRKKRKEEEINEKKHREDIPINLSILVGVILGILVSTICLVNVSWLGFGCIIIGGISGYISLWITGIFAEGIFGYSETQKIDDRHEVGAIAKQIHKKRDHISKCLVDLKNLNYKDYLQKDYEDYLLDLPLSDNLIKRGTLISKVKKLVKNSKYEKKMPPLW